GGPGHAAVEPGGRRMPPNRNTPDVIAEAGLRVQGLERFGFSVLPGNPRLAHVLGAARKP
ncbi:MAG TPA: SAM-dependent methyltransferase, partial [Arthrobacter sp.]|nr:SAM-dependent methyltransferase [Arthrobacter sp.]